MWIRLFAASLTLSLATTGCGEKNPKPAEPKKVTKAPVDSTVAQPETPATRPGDPVAEATKAPPKPADAPPRPGVEPPPTPDEPIVGEDDDDPVEDDDGPAEDDSAPVELDDTLEDVPVTAWMSWEGGVDFVGMTKPGLPGPNVIFHIGRVVHTPVGSAPSGMILYQPDADKPPVAVGFISADEAVGAYFGPKIFAGTPFEKAPVTKADIEVTWDAESHTAVGTAKVGGHTFKATFSEVGDGSLVAREPAQMTPFYQQGVEAKAAKVVFEVDGKPVAVTVPPVGLAGGPGAVFSATGVYAR